MIKMPKPILGRLVAIGVVPESRPGDFGDVDLNLSPSAVMADAITLSGTPLYDAKSPYKVTMTREQLSKAISLIDDFNGLMEKAT
jgi:hypothetical protein